MPCSKIINLFDKASSLELTASVRALGKNADLTADLEIMQKRICLIGEINAERRVIQEQISALRADGFDTSELRELQKKARDVVAEMEAQIGTGDGLAS